MTIPAGVVTNTQLAAIIATVDVTAQSHRSAVPKGAKCTQLPIIQTYAF
jgi:hypothetical protein